MYKDFSTILKDFKYLSDITYQFNIKHLVDEKVQYSFLIVARQKSQRLPNKLFKKILNKTIIEHMIDRIKNGLSKKIILCTEFKI